VTAIDTPSSPSSATSPGSAPVRNRYLEGNFAPVPFEATAYALDVTGTLPPGLSGRYVRTGPNPIAADPANHHWFVGDGMVHGVRLDGGTAGWYRNRWVRSPEVAAWSGQPPVPSAGGGLFPGSGNTNVVHHAGMLLAINELSSPYELSPELETRRQIDFGGPLPAGINAHPKFDPDTGEMHVMAYSFVEPFLRYHVIDATGQLVRSEELAVGGPIMVHDMALTETQVLVLDLPVVFDLDLAMAGKSLPYRWDDDYTPRVGLMPRAGSATDTVWIEVDPCYVYHPLNAYDDGGRVVVDLVVHPAMFRVDQTGPNEGVPTLERWTLDPAAGTARREQVDARPQEFPRADERLATKRHRYGYTTHARLTDFDGSGDEAAGVLKVDFESGAVEAHTFAPGRVPGEFVFVPATEGAGEDEGWLLGYVYDRTVDRSELVVLDATDVTAEPVARVHLPVRVPAGFHGNWIPDRAFA
jgi:carotenoid cleavage oxygenase